MHALSAATDAFSSHLSLATIKIPVYWYFVSSFVRPLTKAYAFRSFS
jgi:hypothetical protein